MDFLYYEDAELHQKLNVGEYYVDKAELIEFSKKWDPMPFHTDEELAKSYPFGGLIAPAVYTLSVIRRLTTITEQPRLLALAGLGFEEIQMHNPVRPGDKLTITEEYIEKRESRTSPERGIVRALIEVKNQNNELCLSTIVAAMIAKRQA